MRDGKRQSVHFVGPGVVARLVAQEPEKRNRPGVAGDARGEVPLGKPLEAMLEHAPQSTGVGKGGGDFVGQAAPGIQSEVGGPLAGKVAGQKLIEDVRPEQAAFDSDGG